MPSDPPLLEVRGLVKQFRVTRRAGLRSARLTVRAVDGVSLTVRRGETLGLVGESGCGKTTTGRAVLRLIEPTAGDILLDGQPITTLGGEPLRKLRRRMNIVFQDPYAALDPRMMVGQIVAEPLAAHRLYASKAERARRAGELLDLVGLRPEMAERYPHEFSGGQRQRIGIARAIATNPELLVLDEPISALDISIRAQILNLLSDLQLASGMGYILIAHDLSVVRAVCHRVAVMYMGVIVEEGPADRVFNQPKHPYTQALIAAAPALNAGRRERITLSGEPASPLSVPSGCRFRTRCPLAQERCAALTPEMRPMGAGQFAACHFAVPADGGELS